MEPKSKIVLTGMSRIKIGERKDGKLKVVGDSGWCQNEVTNLGFAYFIIGCFAPDTDNSIQPTHMQLGTGTEPAADRGADPSDRGERSRHLLAEAVGGAVPERWDPSPRRDPRPGAAPGRRGDPHSPQGGQPRAHRTGLPLAGGAAGGGARRARGGA